MLQALLRFLDVRPTSHMQDATSVLSFTALDQGLTAACAPEVSIIQSMQSMNMLQACMVFTVRADKFKQLVKKLVVDHREELDMAGSHDGTKTLSFMIHAHETAFSVIAAMQLEKEGKDAAGIVVELKTPFERLISAWQICRQVQH